MIICVKYLNVIKMLRPGKKIWSFAAGHIPLTSTGKEPEFTSHDKIAVLNCSDEDAVISIAIYYEDRDPVIDHQISVGARRLRKIRFNDLIKPLPVPRDVPFGFTVRSNVEIIVQFSRLNTGCPHSTGFCVTPLFQKNT
jgi:hypothetical protein